MYADPLTQHSNQYLIQSKKQKEHMDFREIPGFFKEFKPIRCRGSSPEASLVSSHQHKAVESFDQGIVDRARTTDLWKTATRVWC